MIRRKGYLTGAILLAILGAGLLTGCSGKSAESAATPGTPEERQRKDSEAQSKESGGGPKPASANDHGNTTGETGGAAGSR